MGCVNNGYFRRAVESWVTLCERTVWLSRAGLSCLALSGELWVRLSYPWGEVCRSLRGLGCCCSRVRMGRIEERRSCNDNLCST